MPAQLIGEYDIWKPGYDGAIVSIYIAGTSTLASIFTDENLTVPAVNPQLLDAKTDVNGTSYGKFRTSLYTGQPYYCSLDIGEDTGIKRPPLTTLAAQNASDALVTVEGSSTANSLEDIVGRVIHAQNYGQIIAGGSVGSAATNTTTIAAAIGALGTSGIVILPAGVIRCNQFSLPAGVIMQGQGESATTLQIVSGDKAVIITGDKAGFRDMTLDGTNLTVGSIGIYALNLTALLFENFTLTRFETGLYLKGANNPQWRTFSIINCTNGAKLHGDTDAGDTGDGSTFLGGRWDGGTVAQCATLGVDMRYIDALMAHFALENVFFDSNPGTAVLIKGAQFVPLLNCRWAGNGLNIDISDDTTTLAPSIQYQNKAISLIGRGGLMSGGTVKATANAADVVFEHMKVLNVTFNLVATILNNVILKDCFEIGTVLTGATTQLVRQSGEDEFEVVGVTTNNSATRACGFTLGDGQVIYVEGKIIGKQRNGVNKGIYHIACGGYRAGAALAYNTQTANFTVGDVLTGATSGATARIQADSDGGATGTLTIADIGGVFQNGEIITGSTTGSANVNGTVTQASHSLDSVGLVSMRTAYETDAAWDVTVAATAGEIVFRVTGNSSQTIDWTVHMKAVKS